MPRQNRVTPYGALIAVPDRGMFWGSRGALHDARLHADRLAGPGARRTYQAPLARLPDGTMVELEDAPFLVHGAGLATHRDRGAPDPVDGVGPAQGPSQPGTSRRKAWSGAMARRSASSADRVPGIGTYTMSALADRLTGAPVDGQLSAFAWDGQPAWGAQPTLMRYRPNQVDAAASMTNSGTSTQVRAGAGRRAGGRPSSMAGSGKRALDQ
jgi:hypothetical protein